MALSTGSSAIAGQARLRRRRGPERDLADRAAGRVREQVGVHHHRAADHGGHPIRFRRWSATATAAARAAGRLRSAATALRNAVDAIAPPLRRVSRASAGPGPAAATVRPDAEPSSEPRPPSRAGPGMSPAWRTAPRTENAARAPNRSSAPPDRPARASGKPRPAARHADRSTRCSGSGRTCRGQVSGSRVRRDDDDQGNREAAGDQHHGQDHAHRQLVHQGTIVDMQLTHFGHSCLLAEFDHDHACCSIPEPSPTVSRASPA